MALVTAQSESCIRFGVFEWMPFIVTSSETVIIGGTMLPILDIISKKLGRCYELVTVSRRNIGMQLDNGSWTGLIGMIVEEDVDMTGLGLSITPQRFDAMDVSEYLYMDEVTASYARPTTGANIAGFSNPFRMPVWILTLAAIILVSIICYIVAITYHKIVKSKRPQYRSGKYCSTIAESSYWTFGTLLSQSFPNILTGDSVRLVGGFWMLASLVLATTYRSTLKAMLILPSISLPFDNLQELAESDLPICTNPGSMFHLAIVSSPDNTSLGRIKHQLVEKGRRHEGVQCMGISNYWNGVYAVVAPMSAILQIMHSSFSSTGKCQIYAMSENFFKTTALALMFSKGSPLKEKVDPIIMQLRETGILTKLYDRGVFNATECKKSPALNKAALKAQRTMQMKDYYGVFLIYSGGVIISLLVFFAEVIHGMSKS